MLIFPCIYVVSFFTAAYRLFKNNQEGVLVFLIFGLPIYITSLSIVNMYGFGSIVSSLQLFKEISILIALITFYRYSKFKIVFREIDWLMLAYIVYNLIYIILPIGQYSFIEKLLAFKGISFFPFVYFSGRLCDFRRINITKWLNYICLLAIIAGIVLLFEIIPYRHLQTYTGYADFNARFFNVEPAGNYDLTWTFESINGIKRFASFFSMPLEHAAASLISISAIAALATNRSNKIQLNSFLIISFLFTLLSISFAFSRASFASYFLMIYVYMHITDNKQLIKLIHWGLLIVAIVIFIWLKGDIYEVITTTIDFSDSSSLSHLFEWISGIQSIGSNPFGLGLGNSGRVAGSFGENIGGENQLIIIGVQTGLITIILYISAYISLIAIGFRLFKRSHSLKARRIGLLIVVLKIGLIIPLLTSEIETYIYISYFVWFFSGLMVSMNKVTVQHPIE